jgi:hypothetical protein
MTGSPQDALSGQITDAAAQRTILLAEYAALRGEITTMLSLQGQFLSFSMLFFGFVVTMASRDMTDVNRFMPLLPIPFGVLGLSYADVAFRIMRAAHYIHRELRPRLDGLGGDHSLGWETYIRDEYPARRLMQWMDRLRWIFFLGPALAFTVLAFPRPLPPLPWWSWRGVAWTLSVVIVCLNVFALNRVAHFAKRVTRT